MYVLVCMFVPSTHKTKTYGDLKIGTPIPMSISKKFFFKKRPVVTKTSHMTGTSAYILDFLFGLLFS